MTDRLKRAGIVHFDPKTGRTSRFEWDLTPEEAESLSQPRLVNNHFFSEGWQGSTTPCARCNRWWDESEDSPCPKAIINLTQHDATPEQGVVEPNDKELVRTLLTFGKIPDGEEMATRAAKLASIAAGAGAYSAMIGGAPYFMSTLEDALIEVGIVPVYAFSERQSTEVSDPETGETRKQTVFKHIGFVAVKQ